MRARLGDIVLAAALVPSAVHSLHALGELRPRIEMWCFRDERRAVLSLMSIQSIQAQLYEADCCACGCGSGEPCRRRGRNLGELGRDGLLDPVLAAGIKYGYEFELSADQKTSWCIARPIVPDAGACTFVGNRQGVFVVGEESPAAPLRDPRRHASHASLPTIDPMLLPAVFRPKPGEGT